MDVIVTILILSSLHLLKHKLKAKSYIDDTYNYAFASLTAWSRKPGRQLLFDQAADASTASSPPFYPSIYRYLILKANISPLTIQSFFDWLAQIMLFLIVYYELSLPPAIIAVLIFNLSPLVFKDTLYFTDRLWAATLLWINIWSLAHYYLYSNTTFLIIAIASYAVLILSHKHSFQMLAICYLVLSLFYMTSDFLMVALIAELVATLITLGFSLEIHREHLRLLRFAWNYLFPPGKGGYGYDQLLFIRKQDMPDKPTSPYVKSFLINIMSKWDYILYTAVTLLIIVTVFKEVFLPPPVQFYTVVLISIYITSILTQCIRKLKFIGEGNRYLQYAVFPAVMVIWPISKDLEILWQTMAATFVGLWTLGALFIDIKSIKATSRNIVNLLDNDFWKFTEEIKNQRWDRFIVLPIQKTYAFAWLTGKKILHFLGARGFWQAKDWFPQIRKPLPAFYDEYNIDYVALDERYVKPTDIELGPVHEIHRVNSWVVFKIDRPDEGPKV